MLNLDIQKNTNTATHQSLQSFIFNFSIDINVRMLSTSCSQRNKSPHSWRNQFFFFLGKTNEYGMIHQRVFHTLDMNIPKIESFILISYNLFD